MLVKNSLEDKVQQDVDYEESYNSQSSSIEDEQEAMDSVHIDFPNSGIAVPLSSDKSPMAAGAQAYSNIRGYTEGQHIVGTVPSFNVNCLDGV